MTRAETGAFSGIWTPELLVLIFSPSSVLSETREVLTQELARRYGTQHRPIRSTPVGVLPWGTQPRSICTVPLEWVYGAAIPTCCRAAWGAGGPVAIGGFSAGGASA